MARSGGSITLRLIDALAVLLPDGMDGGISTNPFGYRPFIDVESNATWQLFTERMVDVPFDSMPSISGNRQADPISISNPNPMVCSAIAPI
ncbi:MAG: hypothetical protein R2845_06495 [Thermomicrobiales bacterium]